MVHGKKERTEKNNNNKNKNNNNENGRLKFNIV
jgi:hypothetical protein